MDPWHLIRLWAAALIVAGRKNVWQSVRALYREFTVPDDENDPDQIPRDILDAEHDSRRLRWILHHLGIIGRYALAVSAAALCVASNDTIFGSALFSMALFRYGSFVLWKRDDPMTFAVMDPLVRSMDQIEVTKWIAVACVLMPLLMSSVDAVLWLVAIYG